MTRGITVAAGTFLAVASSVLADAPPQYHVTDLTAIIGWQFGTAWSIDGNSNVGGEGLVCGALYAKTGASWALSPPSADCGSWIWALTPIQILDDGTMVGYTTPTAASSYAYLIKDGVFTILPTGSNSGAYGVNALGQIVGAMGSQAFVCENFIVTPLPTPSSAYSITDDSVIVGSSNGQAALWHFARGEWTPTLLGIRAAISDAVAMNAAGQIAGIFRRTSTGPQHPFLWSEAEGFIDLGTLGGTHAAVSGITPSGDVVGYSNRPVPGHDHPFVWHDGVMYDLNDIADGGTFEMRYGMGVSPRGEIVGWGENPAQPSHAYIATPIISGDLNLDARVNATDLGVLLGSWGPCAACANCAADFDHDCDVDSTDLAILLGAWTE